MAALFPNAAAPLTTPTYEGSGQTVHPSVIDFLAEYGIASWRGYRYWMAHTPYPGGNDDFENPSLLASHDGVTWVTPPNINNPLTAGRPGFDAGGGAVEESDGWNADPDLSYDPVANVLRLYFASAEYDHEGVSYFACAESGHSDTFQFVRTNTGGMSPTVVRESADKWHMWDCETGLRYRFSTDGITWGAPSTCSIPYGDVWHVEVKRNPHNGKLEMLLNTGFDLYHFKGDFDTPTVWTLVFDDQPTYALERAPSGWDSTRIYRSSLSFDPSDPLLRRVWYSALGTLGWRVGYSEAALPAPDYYDFTFGMYSVPEAIAGDGAVTFEAQGALEALLSEDTFALTFDLFSVPEAIAGIGSLTVRGSGNIRSTVTVTPDLLSAPATVESPSIQTSGAVAVAVDRVETISAVSAPTIAADRSVVVETDSLNTLATLSEPTLSTDTFLTPGRLDAPSTTHDPDISTSSVVTPSRTDTIGILHDPTLVVGGSVAVGVDTLEAASELREPIVATQGNVTVLSDTLDATSAILDSTVAIDAVATPERTDTDTILYQPTVTTSSEGSVLVTPERTDATSVVSEPSLLIDSTIDVGFLTAMAMLYQPIINPPVGIRPPFFSKGKSVRDQSAGHRVDSASRTCSTRPVSKGSNR